MPNDPNKSEGSQDNKKKYDLENEAKTLWQEAKELNLIFNSIYQKVNK